MEKTKHTDQKATQTIIQCVKSAVCDNKFIWTNDNEAIAIADRHDIAHFLSEKKAMEAMYKFNRQAQAQEQLRNCFNQAKIEFILLKGAVIRQYYPEPWMRTSADIDILVHAEDLSNARDIVMNKMGYKYHTTGTHHDVLESTDKIITVEIHFLLLEDDRIPSASKVLANVWDYSEICYDSYERKLCTEMFYYYHIVHMAKHFQRGGCGIRYFLDLWILRHRADFDIRKCENFVRDHGLEKFEREAVALSENWFSGLDIKVNELFAERVFAGNLYGTPVTKIEFNSAKHSNKLSAYISRIFMSPSLMKKRYPAVDKCIILLPLFWIVRWVQVFTQGDVKLIKKEIKIIGSTDRDYNKRINELFETLDLNK